MALKDRGFCNRRCMRQTISIPPSLCRGPASQQQHPLSLWLATSEVYHSARHSSSSEYSVYFVWKSIQCIANDACCKYSVNHQLPFGNFHIVAFSRNTAKITGFEKKLNHTWSAPMQTTYQKDTSSKRSTAGEWFVGMKDDANTGLTAFADGTL